MTVEQFAEADRLRVSRSLRKRKQIPVPRYGGLAPPLCDIIKMIPSNFKIISRSLISLSILILIASCKSPTIDISGDWQSAYTENDYSEISFVDDSVYLFSELSLAISAFRYEIIDSVIFMYNDGSVVGPEIPSKIKPVDENHFYWVYYDSSKQYVSRIGPQYTYTLSHVRFYEHDYDSFYKAFWKRRLDFLLSIGITPKYEYLEIDRDFTLDSIEKFIEN